MHLNKVRIKNFRRLCDVKIDLDREISIFVGANNSGKTSVAQAINLFLTGARDRVSFHDISANRWPNVEAFSRGDEGVSLPSISIDLWFEVRASDLHRVIDLLPSLDWQGSRVGIRVIFDPINQDETLTRFREKHALAQEAADAAIELVGEGEADNFVVSPQNLTEFLKDEITREYEFRYFVLDPARFDDDLEEAEGYEPVEFLKAQGRGGKEILDSLIKVDYLHAQRHLSDTSGSRAEELSKRLGRYYSRNLEKHADDFNALRALSQSEIMLNQHLEHVFAETLERLADLGYPGFSNPRLVIKSALNPATVMSSNDGTHVHYALDDSDLTLPDKYNGLGFKNLIYMVVELLDLHAQWISLDENRPPLHLVFVEEPEAHLHAQLQQVFVKKVIDLLNEEGDDTENFSSQLALTTHSPHILYERGFQPIRYFRRQNVGSAQCTQVLNLSEFYERTANPSRDFLERYLKLTHCDLFFADAAVLVEGNVERLLMPHMIQKAAPGLKSTYLSVLEIGGAFGHRFQTLIDYLGITTLIITDLDSVYGPLHQEDDEAVEEDRDLEELAEELPANDPTPGKTCMPEEIGALTSNEMLRQWLPARERITELLALPPEDKTLRPDETRMASVRVTYPSSVNVTYGDENDRRAGRTLEVAFTFENVDWTQASANADLGLRIRNPADINAFIERLHKRVHSSYFKKTDFALALLAKIPDEWNVPSYIAEGLEWLERELCAAQQVRAEPEGEAQ